jgi:hypothetical protein
MGRRLSLKGRGLTRTGVFLVVLGLAMVAWIAPAIASAWLSCDGLDPVIALDGKQKLSVQIDWPSKYSCSIQGPIEVQVSVPAGMDARLVKETVAETSCGTISTVTSITNRSGDKRSDQVQVAVKINASQSFPAIVTVSVDGNVARVLRGSSSSGIKGWVSIGGK